ncbi:YceH family protein [Granulicella cerasi]|uniref:YceH family protein n=1 Tax=Granulicella cerasi TaxID=741063 RepID=A0ABW1ZA33_9BACT|nr:YceH family protein [Granulicella cerasi]
MLNLNPVEVRVLGSLSEKEITTPEYYPLSLNALVNACNQKSSRDPVMELTEADVRTALFELEGMGFVRVLNDSRATKFEHLLYSKLELRRPEIALVGLLLLRGPQTPAELRTRAERMYSFDDNTAVVDALTRLASRETPLVAQMNRQPGSREARWTHLLGGEVELGAATPVASVAAAPDHDRVAALEALVHALTDRIAALEAVLGGKDSIAEVASESSES